MFCLRNQDITDAKAFFHLFFMSNSGYLDKQNPVKVQQLSDQERIKQLERENKELQRANEILRKAAAFFAQAELDRPHK